MPLLFSRPVIVLEGISTRRGLRSVEAVSEWLVSQWPAPKGRKRYKMAVRACMAALEGRVTPEEARAAFAAAAEAEGVLLDG